MKRVDNALVKEPALPTDIVGLPHALYEDEGTNFHIWSYQGVLAWLEIERCM